MDRLLQGRVKEVEDAVWGCEFSANPRIEVNLSIPLFWLYQPFKVVNNMNLAKLEPQCLSEGKAVRGRFSKFTVSPWLLPWIWVKPLTTTATST